VAFGENDRERRSDAASRLCGQFAVIDLPNLRYSSGRIIASEISDRVCHVPRYVGQDDAPGDHIRPRLWPERTNQSLIRYPRTQHLSGFCIGHDFRRDTEIPVRVLLGFQHTQILAGLGQWTKSGVWGNNPREAALWLQADVIVHCASEPLLAAQVAFCRLYRDVPQEKLNLLKLSTGGVA
jgi:hypothetical protein